MFQLKTKMPNNSKLIKRKLQLLRFTIFPEKTTQFFRSLVLDTMKTREEKGIVRPDMLQLLMEAKMSSLQDANTSDNKSEKTGE